MPADPRPLTPEQRAELRRIFAKSDWSLGDSARLSGAVPDLLDALDAAEARA